MKYTNYNTECLKILAGKDLALEIVKLVDLRVSGRLAAAGLDQPKIEVLAAGSSVPLIVLISHAAEAKDEARRDSAYQASRRDALWELTCSSFARCMLGAFQGLAVLGL
ncbi:hypothetical protein PoB_000224200 [Plakobranchus ocellatus]|uniref:Uncharacterized protein n=1 Tax=Plakobranchus ocellatus TaxID=259542 RepID=A0AAV3XZ33_9GAST|nr:hypothetical protein PoB_000224200 [Plakobranchus ocellatus]